MDTHIQRRLERCAVNGKARRRDPYNPAYQDRCGLVVCPSCRCRHVGRAAQRAAAQFADADIADLSLVTVLLAQTRDPGNVRGAAADLRRRLRNLRARSIKSGGQRWAQWQLWGYAEVAAIGAEEQDLLGPRWSQALPDLPVLGSGAESDVVWLPHAHLISHAPRLDWQAVRDALEGQWPGRWRVDVRPLRGQDHEEAISRIARYATKAGISRSLWGDGVPYMVDWPDAWIDAWHTEVSSWRQGLRPLSVTMRAVGSRAGAAESVIEPDAAEEGDYVGPAPIVCRYSDALLARSGQVWPSYLRAIGWRSSR